MIISRLWWFFASDNAKRRRAFADLTAKMPDADPDLIRSYVTPPG